MSDRKNDPVWIAEQLTRDPGLLERFWKYGAWHGSDMDVQPELYHQIKSALSGDASESESRTSGPDDGWLESAADLLAEPDPGPTPFVVDELLVDAAIAAIQGPHKVGKTWFVLELAISIVTGQPALGRFAIPHPGPVVVVLEESGRAALHRRLDALRRGCGLEASDLASLYFAANRRVRLDDRHWQDELMGMALSLQPRAVFLDPLARLKGATRDENVQKEMAPVLDFMRDLRDATQSLVAFTHHTGHEGTHLRGTSDLEAYWESKVAVKRTGAVHELVSEHREAEAGRTVHYRLDWHHESRSVRLTPIDDQAEQDKELLDYLSEHPGKDTEQVAKGVHRNKERTRSRLLELEEAGTVERRRSERPDRDGRSRSYQGWYPASQAALLTVPSVGTMTDREHSAGVHGPTVPPLIGRTGNADRVTGAGNGLGEPATSSSPQRVGAATEGDELLGANAVCKRLGKHRQQLKRWRDRGEFPEADEVIGGRKLWLTSTVDTWWARVNGKAT